MPSSEPDVITLADGRQLDADAFYAERDARTEASGARYRLQRVRSAIVIPSRVKLTAPVQTALLWTASQLRRMGRPFAETRIVTSADTASTPYRGTLHLAQDPQSLREAVELELLGADPFGSVIWRHVADPDALDDVDIAICLGTWPDEVGMKVPRGGRVEVCARGWTVKVARIPSQISLTGEEFGSSSTTASSSNPREVVQPSDRDGEYPLDAAAATVVAAAAFASSAVYDWARVDGSIEAGAGPALPESGAQPEAFWFSADTGRVTTDLSEGEAWWTRGSSAVGCAPWSAAQGEPVLLATVIMVAAGGLGGNAAQVLAASYVRTKEVIAVDTDRIDVSNLNRLIGIGVDNVGSMKATLAAGALCRVDMPAKAALSTYEAWALQNRSILTAPGSVAIVGVDQVATRFEAQADWPSLVINGATSGTGWHVSSHPRGAGGCLGCFYAPDRRSYATIRSPHACAGAGGGPMLGVAVASAPAAAVPFVASYSFASVSAAAVMTARLIRLMWQRTQPEAATSGDGTGREAEVARLNLLRPQFGSSGPVLRHADCVLLCSEPALDAFLGRAVSDPGTDKHEQPHASEERLQADVRDPTERSVR